MAPRIGLLVASIGSLLAVLAAAAGAHADEPAPTSAPGCLFFVPATTWSPPHCEREHPEPGPLDGLNAVGYTGAGLTMAGMAGTTMGIALVLHGYEGRDPDEDLMLGGGITAGVGVLLIAVGAPMWALGKDEAYGTKVGIGAGSVQVAGTF